MTPEALQDIELVWGWWMVCRGVLWCMTASEHGSRGRSWQLPAATLIPARRHAWATRPSPVGTENVCGAEVLRMATA